MTDIWEIGPVGGLGGSGFSDFEYRDNTLTEIRIAGGEAVDSLTLVYGKDILHHGGPNGEAQKLTLKSGDYITRVSGYYGTYAGNQVIRYLKITTKNGESLAAGYQAGVEFNIDLPSDYKVAAFLGRADRLLDAVGLYFRKA